MSTYVWITTTIAGKEGEKKGEFDVSQRVGPTFDLIPQRRLARANIGAVHIGADADGNGTKPLELVQDHMLCVTAFRLLPLTFLGTAPLTGCENLIGTGVCDLGPNCQLPTFIDGLGRYTPVGALTNHLGERYPFKGGFECPPASYKL